MPILDAHSIINITVLIIAIQVSFEKAMYSGEEGKVISEIRLKSTEFETPFSFQIFATTLDASRPEKENEATSGELCVLLVLHPVLCRSKRVHFTVQVSIIIIHTCTTKNHCYRNSNTIKIAFNTTIIVN